MQIQVIWKQFPHAAGVASLHCAYRLRIPHHRDTESTEKKSRERVGAIPGRTHCL